MQYKVFGCKVNKYYTDLWLNSKYLQNKKGTFVASCVVTDNAKRKWIRFVKKEVASLESFAKVYISGCGAFKQGKAQENFFDIYPELSFAQEKIEVLDEAPPEEDQKISIHQLLGTSHHDPHYATNFSNYFSQKNKKISNDSQLRSSGKKDTVSITLGQKINLSKLETLKKTQIYTRKYVLIQGGCDSFCTFCLTVQKRGRHFYRSMEDIAREIQDFSKIGGKEAVLTGVNLAAWGLSDTHTIKNFSSEIIKNGKRGENKSRLSELLRYILRNTSIPRLRISSLGPEFINDEIIEVFHENRIIPHFHFSIQSGSTHILKNMARHYDGEYMETLLKKIQSISRYDGVDISIGADIIIGFPGETQQDFIDTYKLIKNYNIAKVHAFPFSAHNFGESVPAGKFKNQISEDIKKQRMNKIHTLGEKLAEKFYISQRGKILEVLVEKSKKISSNLLGNTVKTQQDAYVWSGWTQNYIEANDKNFKIIQGVPVRNEIITGILI